MADYTGHPREEEIRDLLLHIPHSWGRAMSIGAGWIDLVLDLHKEILKIDPDYTVFQVKEKFGGLRFYFETSDTNLHSRLSELTETAEHRSHTICERCGSTDEVHTHTLSGWLATLCQTCYEEEEAWREYEESQS